VSEGIAQLLLNLGTRRWCVVSITPRPPLPLGKSQVPIEQEAGWAPEPVWIGVENLAPLGFDPWTFQPIVSCYTDYAVLAPEKIRGKVNYFITTFEIIFGLGGLDGCFSAGKQAVVSAGKQAVDELKDVYKRKIV
jgi:hypothetical protein